jgi:hypothetical protein
MTRLKWKLNLVHLEIVLIKTQGRCMLCIERTRGSVIVLYTLDELLGDKGHVESHFGLFGDSITAGA